MLLERGRVFEEAAIKEGLNVVPFDAGFFACIACDKSDEISEKLAEKGNDVYCYCSNENKWKVKKVRRVYIV